MKNLKSIIILIIALSYWPFFPLWASETKSLSERNYFQFTIPKYHTKRQSGQIVDIYVRYAYKSNLPTNEYPDYRILRKKILSFMEPSAKFPAKVYWEILATHMGKTLMHDFPIEGVSIQLTVHDNQNPDRYEPSDHGPIFTMGKITPLNRIP